LETKTVDDRDLIYRTGNCWMRMATEGEGLLLAGLCQMGEYCWAVSSIGHPAAAVPPGFHGYVGETVMVGGGHRHATVCMAIDEAAREYCTEAMNEGLQLLQRDMLEHMMGGRN
jgi:hypothetical protein